MTPRKRYSEKWWECYRAVVVRWNPGADPTDGFYPRAYEATNAVFETLGIDPRDTKFRMKRRAAAQT